MSEAALQVAKLRRALDEVLDRRDSFSEEAFTQIILAIYDKIRVFQTTPEAQQDNSQDEIRLVTIMFVDIVDSTKMTLALNADEWKATIGDAHNQVASLIHKHDGEVGQYLGDGLLCYFGTVRSHDDDALRAVQCALDIHATIAHFARTIYLKHTIEFNVRIGISSGRAVVGMFGNEGNRTLLALGAPTNLAARLQNIAEPGETLIDAQTYRLARNQIVTQSRPLATIKGFETPVEYYAALSTREQRPNQLAANHIARVATPFVGRTAQLHRLMDVLRQPTWQVATIYGDIGLGKSRLLQEVLASDAARTYDALLLVGNPQKKNVAYGLFQDWLIAQCDLRDDNDQTQNEQQIVDYVRQTWDHPAAEASAHALGYLTGFGFENSPHVRALQQGAGPEQTRMGYALVARWLRGVAEAHPLLLVVDNLHWVDRASLGLLEYVVQEMIDLPGALLATARPDFYTHYPAYMDTIDHVVTVELDPLDVSEIDQIIKTVFEQVEQVPPTLPPMIRQRAEGNPLFVEEFIYMLFDNGIIQIADDGTWSINRFQYNMRSAELPDGLLAILQARLDELSTDARQVIQMAAAMGTTFWPGAFRQLMNENAVVTALNDLEARGLIVATLENEIDNDTEYSFRQTLYRDLVYAMLARQTRIQYHRVIAAWLQQHVEKHPQYLSSLAEHYLQSEQHAQALKTYMLAAQHRFERGLLLETLNLIEAGLDAAREVDRDFALPRVGFLWMLQGQVLDALNRYEESSAASETALMLLSESGEQADERAAAARTLGSAMIQLGRYEQAFDALNRANSLLPPDATRQHAALLRTFGMLFHSRGQLNEALAYEQQALTLAQDAGDSREQARIMAILSVIALNRGEFASALTYCEQVLALNRAAGNLYYQIMDLSQMATIYRALFDHETALALCAEAIPLQNRIRYASPLIQVNQAISLLSIGQTEKGWTLLREIAVIKHQNIVTQQRIQLGYIIGLSMMGDYQQCYEGATRLLDVTRDQNFILYGRALLWQGIAMNALERPGALDVLHEALDTELIYAGRNAWLCYYALGAASRDLADQRHWYSEAVSVLQATAMSLHTRPELQRSLRNQPVVRWLLDMSKHTE